MGADLLCEASRVRLTARVLAERRCMLDFRKLAAIDIVFLGYQIVFAEYVCGVVLPIVLGILSFVKGHSVTGAYLISLGINYSPMLIYVVSIGNREKARAELGDELTQQRRALAKYRKLSVLLLMPLFVPLNAILKRSTQKTRRLTSD